MERFTIRDIENLCQIKAHTLRIWEQRFSFFQAQRKESLHRFYDNKDLQTLLQVAYLYHGGMKISQIAALDERGRLATMAEMQQRGGAAEQEVLALVQAAASFNEPAFRQTLNRVVEKQGLEEAVLNVCFPFLQRVGHLWLTNHVIPAQEHFSSYLIQNKIISETDKLPVVEARHPDILLLTPRGERHELPLLFINYLLRANGWPVTYLGTNVQMQELPTEVVDRAGLIYVHLLTNLTGLSADDYFASLCTHYPEKTIVASGSAVQALERRFVNLRLLQTDADILAFIRQA